MPVLWGNRLHHDPHTKRFVIGRVTPVHMAFSISVFPVEIRSCDRHRGCLEVLGYLVPESVFILPGSFELTSNEWKPSPTSSFQRGYGNAAIALFSEGILIQRLANRTIVWNQT